MRIGIPKALLFYKYADLWTGFFDALGVEYVVSPDTNKDILKRGSSLAVDESCFSSKIYLGHVDWLIGRCDCIFVPRIASYGKAGTVCTRFQGIYDMVQNTFRDSNLTLLHYNINLHNGDNELKAFIKLGAALGSSKSGSLRAYLSAKQAQKEKLLARAKEQKKRLAMEGIKVLLIAHPYNICDEYIGRPIMRVLEDMGVISVLGCAADKKSAVASSYQLSETLPWIFSKELLGSIALYRRQIDGIILISAFPCGPDSMVNEIIIRRVKDKPILNLILDGQDGTAGLETRLESFMDIISFRKEHDVGSY